MSPHTVRAQTLNSMLQNRLYFGEVASKDFGVSRRGDFEALISEDVFHAAQSALTGRSSPRKQVDPDFPLRGFVNCETCQRPLTASRSKGALAITLTTIASGHAGR